MKTVIYIVTVIILVSCSKHKKTNQLIEYINCYSEMNEKHEKFIRKRLFETEQELPNNPRYIYILNKIKRVVNQANTMIFKIEKIKQRIRKSDSISLKDVYTAKFKLDIRRRDELFIETENYLDTILSHIRDKDRYENFVNGIKNELNTNSWKKQNGFDGNSCNALELYAILTKIQYDIKIAERDIISHFCRGSNDFWSLMYLKSAIAPNSKVIKTGDNFRANIFFGLVDTTFTPSVWVEGKELEPIYHQIIYKEYIKQNRIGKTMKNGSLKHEHPATKEILSLPFKLEYEVIE